MSKYSARKYYAESTIRQLEIQLSTKTNIKCPRTSLPDIKRDSQWSNRLCSQRTWETDATRDTSVSASGGDDNIPSNASSGSGSVHHVSDGLARRTADIASSRRKSNSEITRGNPRVVDSEFLAKMKARISRAHTSMSSTQNNSQPEIKNEEYPSYQRRSLNKYQDETIQPVSRIPSQPLSSRDVSPSNRSGRDLSTNRTGYNSRLSDLNANKPRRSNSQRIASQEMEGRDYYRQRPEYFISSR